MNLALYAIGAGVLLFWAIANSIALMTLLRRMSFVEKAARQAVRSGLSTELLGTLLNTIANDTVAPLHSLVTLMPEHIEVGKRVQEGLSAMQENILNHLDELNHGREEIEKSRLKLLKDQEHLKLVKIELGKKEEILATREKEIKNQAEEVAKLKELLEEQAIEKGVISGRFLNLDLD